MRTHRRRGLLTALVLALCLASLVACGDDDSEDAGPASTTPTSTTSASTSSTEAPADQTAVRAYFLRDEKVGAVAREANDEAVGAAALQGLLDGPTTAEKGIGFSSAIPAGTRLRGIVVEQRVATVDLSAEFGSGGGSASMQARVAQVVFTLTQFPTIEAVRFELDGEPVTALGGEGLLIDEPQRRSDWEELTPAILVESPLPFAEIASPLRLTGTANTFEAAFRIKVTDADGRTVYDRPAMATSGSGTRGTFAVTATLDQPHAGTGKLTVFEESAEDGRPIHVVELPIRIAA
jgi:hypothetical protein